MAAGVSVLDHFAGLALKGLIFNLYPSGRYFS